MTDELAYQISLPFPVRLIDKATVDDVIYYSWIEQDFDVSTGEYSDMDDGRSGDTTDGPFLTEINNGDITVDLIVKANVRCVADNDLLYEFDAGQATILSGLPGFCARWNPYTGVGLVDSGLWDDGLFLMPVNRDIRDLPLELASTGDIGNLELNFIDTLVINNGSNVTIRGITHALGNILVAGRRIQIVVNAGTVTLKHESGSVEAQAKFHLPGGFDLTLDQFDGVSLVQANLPGVPINGWFVAGISRSSFL